MEDVFRSPYSEVARKADIRREFKKGTRRRDLQRPHSPCTPSTGMLNSSNPLFFTTSPRSRVLTERSHYIDPYCSKPQVYLYNWFLTRVGGGYPENGTAENGVQVALEGYTTSDLLDHEKFRTAPIESRIEKCKLRTVDGLYILLMGAIDEQRTYGNGFPFHVIHFFLTGFPFNWDCVINTCYGQPSLNMSVLRASKEKENAWQEKDVTLNSDYLGIHMEDIGAGKSILLEPEEKISEVTSPRESLVRCSKRGRHVSQPIRSSKRFKCGNLNIKSEPKVFSPFGGILENSNISKESRESMKQINSGSFLAEAKLTQITHSVAKENGSENQTNGHFSSAEDSLHERIDKNEADQSPMVNTYLELENKCILGAEQTLITQIPVSEFPDTSCKTGKLISRNRSHTKKKRMHETLQASRDDLCGEITEEAGKEISNAARYTDQPTELSEASVCYQTVVNHGVVLECNDIDATCCANPYQVESEIEHGTASNHCTKIGNNCQEGNGDGEKGSVQTSKTITKINMQTPTCKRKLVQKIPRQTPGYLPPLPTRRVHTTPEEVAKAYGLKTSRFGRLLVPPLAHWCNQTIAYDLDGGIIAIFDASSERNEDNERLTFKPPEQKDAIKIQKKLRNAANETTRRPNSAKKTCKD